MRIVTLVLISLLISSQAHSRRGQKMNLSAALKFELNQLLKATSSLHEACYKEDEKNIESSLKTLISHIDRANGKSGLAEEKRTHLVKILNAAKNSLILSQSQMGKTRSKSLKNAFAQLVQVTKIYKLDRYRVFFCPKDKSTWVQKSWRAQNPINPAKFGKCGKLVN